MGEIVQRKWGTYEIIAEGPRYKVKRLIMEPGQEFSYQYHHHRGEVWTVVFGTALVEKNEVEQFVADGQFLYFAIGDKHKLTNPGKLQCVIIEVQYGAYLEEDDIVRLD